LRHRLEEFGNLALLCLLLLNCTDLHAMLGDIRVEIRSSDEHAAGDLVTWKLATADCREVRAPPERRRLLVDPLVALTQLRNGVGHHPQPELE
jgi:hypothetical protein